MAYYTSPQLQQFNQIKIDPLDLGSLGSSVGQIMRRNKIANIVKNVQRTPGETDEEYQERVQAQSANVPRGEYVPEGISSTQAPAQPQYTNDVSIIGDLIKRPDYMQQSNAPVVTKSPSIPAESDQSYQQRLQESAGAKRTQEPLSSFYSRLGDQLAKIDPESAMKYKQQAVQQQAIEDWQGKNKGATISQKLGGLGESIFPMDQARGAEMMQAGATTQMGQLKSASDAMDDVSATFAQIPVNDQENWSAQRDYYLSRYPMMKIPAVANQINKDEIMRLGKKPELASVIQGTQPEVTLAWGVLDSAKNALDSARIKYTSGGPKLNKAQNDYDVAYDKYKQATQNRVNPVSLPIQAGPPTIVDNKIETPAPVAKAQKVIKNGNIVDKEEPIDFVKPPTLPVGSDRFQAERFNTSTLAQYNQSKASWEGVQSKILGDLNKEGESKTSSIKALELINNALKTPSAGALVASFSDPEVMKAIAKDSDLSNSLSRMGSNLYEKLTGIGKMSDAERNQIISYLKNLKESKMDLIENQIKGQLMLLGGNNLVGLVNTKDPKKAMNFLQDRLISSVLSPYGYGKQEKKSEGRKVVSEKEFWGK